MFLSSEYHQRNGGNGVPASGAPADVPDVKFEIKTECTELYENLKSLKSRRIERERKKEEYINIVCERLTAVYVWCLKCS